MTNFLGLIPARGGSKGIPGKNIKNLAGKPLIAWTIASALKSKTCSRLIVSTDDEKIASVAREWGAEVPFIRPAHLATDTSASISVVEHALKWLEENEQCYPEYVMLLQPTSPLRSADDICNCVDIVKIKNAIAVVSVCEANPHPYIVKKISDTGTLENFVPTEKKIDRRQDMPPAYALNGAIYVTRCDSLISTHSFTPDGTVAYIMPKERSIDIDSSLDFQFAEFLLSTVKIWA